MRTIIIIFVLTTNILAEEIIGIPRVGDGDTVHINNFKFRLQGIAEPEMRQRCKKEKLKNIRKVIIKIVLPKR